MPDITLEQSEITDYYALQAAGRISKYSPIAPQFRSTSEHEGHGAMDRIGEILKIRGNFAFVRFDLPDGQEERRVHKSEISTPFDSLKAGNILVASTTIRIHDPDADEPDEYVKEVLSKTRKEAEEKAIAERKQKELVIVKRKTQRIRKH